MNKVLTKLKEIKHKEIILAILAVVIMLFIYFSTFTGKDEVESPKGDYCSNIKLEIEQAVSRMEGAGKADVVINWSSGVEIVTAQNTTVNGNSSSSQTVMGSGSPIVIKEIYPKAVGVLIICEGGDNAKVKIDIIMAISTLLDIPADKVLVLRKSK